MLEISPESDGDREVLHAKYLDILSVESKAVWGKQIAEARLKELCAEGEGIDGVCGWPRIGKEREELDIDALMGADEVTYAKYLSSRAPTSAVIVGAKKGY